MVRKETDSAGNTFYYNEKNQYHREDGPALDCSNGHRFWYINGRCHRTDGSAIEYSDGNKKFILMSKQYSYEEWLTIKDFSLLW